MKYHRNKYGRGGSALAEDQMKESIGLWHAMPFLTRMQPLDYRFLCVIDSSYRVRWRLTRCTQYLPSRN